MKRIYQKAATGAPLSDQDLRRIVSAEGSELDELLRLAGALKELALGQQVGLCAIVNARSGRCSEDCRFCAQSSHHRTAAPEYGFIGADRIRDAALAARSKGVTRFGVVVSGKIPGRRELDDLEEAVRAVAGTGLAADLSPGILGPAALVRLKTAGLAGYHHNLETGRSFFPQICTTHDYEEDVEAVRQALLAGLYVCSGGIFGLGETWEHRIELALTLRELGVQSVPINFLQPIQGTPLAHRPLLPPEEALKILALYRFLLPGRHIRVCGGRALVLGERRPLALISGASGIMTGDYLTTSGTAMDQDLDDIACLGLEPEPLAPGS